MSKLDEKYWYLHKRCLTFKEITALHEEYQNTVPDDGPSLIDWMKSKGYQEDTPGSQFWYQIVKINPDASAEYVEKEREERLEKLSSTQK